MSAVPNDVRRELVEYSRATPLLDEEVDPC
jgi:hypothetical protein